MTLEEAKQVRKGHYLSDVKEVKLKHVIYRVTREPWVSVGGEHVRFYIAALGAWVGYERFVREQPGQSVTARVGTPRRSSARR